MSDQFDSLIQEKINKYKQLSYVQFAIMPSILKDYVNCLLIKQMDQYIQHLFRMLVETLFQFVPQLMTHQDSKILKQPHKKLASKIYQLLLIVAVEGKFNQSFWNKYISINFYKVFIPDLANKFETFQHRTYIFSLLSYFQMCLVIQQIRMGNSKNLKLDQFIQSKMTQLRTQLSKVQKLPQNYQLYKQQFLKIYQKLGFILKPFVKNNENIQIDGKSQNGNIQNLQQSLQIEKLIRKGTLDYQRNVNRYYPLCKSQFNKRKFLKKTMTLLITDLSSLQLHQARLLNQLYMEQFQQQQSYQSIMGDIFTNLVIINALQDCFKKQSSMKQIIQSNRNTTKQIFDISKPSLETASLLVYSFLFISNFQRFQPKDKSQISKNLCDPEIYQYLSYMLKNYEAQRKDPLYMKIVLVTLLYEIKASSSKPRIVQKIEQFWKIVQSHQNLVNFINSWDILEVISSLWVLKNWNSPIQIVKYYNKSEQIELNLKNTFLVQGLKFQKSDGVSFQTLQKRSNQMLLMKNLINKKKKTFKQILTHQQDPSNTTTQNLRASVILSQVVYYLNLEKYLQCLKICLKTIKSNLRKLNDIRSNLVSFNQNLMLIVFICLYKLQKYYLALIAADFQVFQQNLQINQSFVNKCLNINNFNNKQKFKFTNQLIVCIFNYDLLQTFSHYNQQICQKIYNWINQEENYQWMTQNKRKKIKIGKMSKFVNYLQAQFDKSQNQQQCIIQI